MTDTTHDAHSGEDSPSPRSDESHAAGASAMTTARLVANPRRVRRA